MQLRRKGYEKVKLRRAELVTESKAECRDFKVCDPLMRAGHTTLDL